MRRLARRAFGHLVTLASAASLLLCVAVCVLWVRSRSASDYAMWSHYRWAADGGALGEWFDLTSCEGRLRFAAGSARAGPPRAELAVGIHLNARESGGRPRLHFDHHRLTDFDRMMLANADAGTSGWGPVRWQRSTSFDPAIPLAQRSVRVSVPHCLAAVLLALPAAGLLTRRLARRRRLRLRLGRGLCIACGYDLRATTPGGRCPECGAPAPTPMRQSPTAPTPTAPVPA